jgi:hypothetical protein
MSSPSDGVVIPEAEVDTPGLYLFNQNELVEYLDLRAASKDESLTKKERNRKRSNAVRKLKNVIKTRMPAAEQEALNSFLVEIPEAEVDTPGIYLFNQKELVAYLDLKAASKDESLTPNQQNDKRGTAAQKLKKVIEQRMSMTEKLVLEANKQAETDRKYQENIQFIEKALSHSTPKQHEDYEALLADSTEPKNSKKKQQRSAGNALQKLKYIIAKHAEEEKRVAMTPEELSMYDNDPERVAAKAEKDRRDQAYKTKFREKEAATNQRKKEEEAKNAKIFPKSVRNSTVLGEGDDERQETLTRTVEEIMGSHAGSALGPSGIPTSEKWVRDHGDVSVGDKLAEGGFAAYLGITRTTVDPGEEEKCRETTLFITQVQRDPLWRMLQKDGDLKLMSPKQAKSVVNVYLLAKYENPYDVTSLEGACQFYLQNELGLPHGICLHKQAGAGKRLKDSMTAAEYKLFVSGKLKGWSLNLTMIRTTDRVFAIVDPFDPERSPPLVSASVPTHDGTGTVYRIRVRGNKQSFPDTPSVVADRKKIKAENERKKASRQKRKRGAAESVDREESPEEMEEKTAKKSKIGVVEGGE